MSSESGRNRLAAASTAARWSRTSAVARPSRSSSVTTSRAVVLQRDQEVEAVISGPCRLGVWCGDTAAASAELVGRWRRRPHLAASVVVELLSAVVVALKEVSLGLACAALLGAGTAARCARGAARGRSSLGDCCCETESAGDAQRPGDGPGDEALPCHPGSAQGAGPLSVRVCLPHGSSVRSHPERAWAVCCVPPVRLSAAGTAGSRPGPPAQ